MQRLQRSADPEDYALIRWQWAQDGAQPVPFMHLFGFRLWDDVRNEPFDGPQILMAPSEYRRTQVSPHPGIAPHGPREFWENGIPADAIGREEVGEQCGAPRWFAEWRVDWIYRDQPQPTSAAQIAAGGLLLGGVAAQAASLAVAGSGGLFLGGVAPAVASQEVTGSGGLLLGGVAPAVESREVTGSGGLLLGGVTPLTGTGPPTGSGGLLWGGDARFGVRGGHIGLPTGIVFDGVADQVAHLDVTGSGGLLLGGVAQSVESREVEGSGGLLLGGVAAGGQSRAVDGSGGVAFGGSATMEGDETVTGQIVWWAGTGAPPAGYLSCDGANVSRTTYATLFSVIGTTYGAGDGSTTFGLPSLRGRFATMPGGPWSAPAVGTYAGAMNVTLVEGNLPAHVHGVPARGRTAAVTTQVVAGELGDNSQGAAQINTTAIGSGTPFNIIPPSLSLQALIKT